VSPVKYEVGFYIPEDDILHSHRRENLKSYIELIGWALSRRRSVFPVRYELGFYIPFFIVTAVKISNLTELYIISLGIEHFRSDQMKDGNNVGEYSMKE
jgi:hypothetical protein